MCLKHYGFAAQIVRDRHLHLTFALRMEG
jgi:hypothetical protein